MPQYEKVALGNYQIGSEGTHLITPGAGITTGYKFDDKCTYKLYCATVEFTTTGTARVIVSAMGDGASVQVQVAKAGATVDPNTGEIDASHLLSNVTESAYQSVEFMAVDVQSGTYEFYIRLARRVEQTAIIVAIDFQPYTTTPWKHKNISLGTRIETNVTRAIPISEQKQYTLYCFYLTSDYTGTGTYIIESTEPAPVKMYIATQGTDTTYSHKTGEIYSQYEIQHEFSSTRMTVKSDYIRHGVHLWVRHDSADTVSPISITIYSPGATWSTFYLGRVTVPSSGYLKQFSVGEIAQKTVDYMELDVGYAGTYQFKVEGSDSMYGYLTTEIDIDSNGIPSSSSVISSDTGSSTGFVFSGTIDGESPHYYLLFRTSDGSANSHSFTLTITPVGEYAYTQESAEKSIAGSRDKNLSFSSTGTRYRVRYFRTTYAGSGTAVAKTNNKISGLVVYMVPDEDYGYNPATGAPYKNSNHTEEAIGGSSQTYNVVPGKDYYIWIRTTYPNVSGTAIANITWKVKSWVYEQYPEQSQLEQVTTTGELSLSEKTGAIFALSFKNTGDASLVLQGMSAATMYLTEGNYGFNSNGVPYANRAKTTLATASRTKTITGVITNQTYYVWVSPLNSTSSGTATVTITPPVKPVTWLLTDRTGDASTKDLDVNLSSKWVDISAAHTVKYAVSFTRSGMATFRSYGNHPVSGYLGDTDVDINPSNGVPTDFDVADIGDNDFEFSAIVNAGDTYYLWIKCNSEFASSGTYLTIIVPENVSTTRGYWFYVNISGSHYEWVKGTPYIGTNDRRWRESKGYVATLEGWPEQY